MKIVLFLLLLLAPAFTEDVRFNTGPKFQGPKFLAGPDKGYASGPLRIKLFYRLEASTDDAAKNARDFLLSVEKWASLSTGPRWVRLGDQQRLYLGFVETTVGYCSGVCLWREGGEYQLQRMDDPTPLVLGTTFQKVFEWGDDKFVQLNLGVRDKAPWQADQVTFEMRVNKKPGQPTGAEQPEDL